MEVPETMFLARDDVSFETSSGLMFHQDFIVVAKEHQHLKPGTPAPVSGLYQEIGPRRGPHGEVTVLIGKILPPTQQRAAVILRFSPDFSRCSVMKQIHGEAFRQLASQLSLDLDYRCFVFAEDLQNAREND